MIRAQGLVKTYGKGSNAYQALRGVDLHIEPREIVAIMGPSGSGKTTLLQTLSGIDKMDEGEIWVGEHALHAMKYAKPLEPLQVGDVIPLQILEKDPGLGKPGTQQPKVAESIEVEIVGFYKAGESVEYQLVQLMLLNPELYQRLKVNGNKMNNVQTQGYVLLEYTNMDVQSVQQEEDLLRAAGISDFESPRKILVGNKAMNDQSMSLYIVFILLAILIGLLGLLIIQYRSVQERSKHFAMLRCIGVNRKDLYYALLVEGCVIGWIGIIVGFAIGSIGGNIYIETTKLIAPPQVEPVTIPFPFLTLLSVMAIIMIVTVMVNVIPARRTLQLKPGEAIRIDED